MIRKTPSFFRLIQVDYPSVLAISFPTMVWIIFLILYIIGLLQGLPALGMLAQTSLVSVLFFTGIVMTIFGTPVLVIRYRMFYGIFSGGEEVEGMIHGVGFFRDRGTVEVIYNYAGKRYTSRSSVQKMDRTKELKPGKKVALIVDQARPERAFIKDLYI